MARENASARLWRKLAPVMVTGGLIGFLVTGSVLVPITCFGSLVLSAYVFAGSKY